MANRSYYQRMFSLHAMPVFIDVRFAIGATGAVGTIKGTGISAVTRLAAGTYKIQFQDNYYRLFSSTAQLVSPGTGSTAVGSITPGNVYTILTLGTTTTAQWVTAGVPVGITPAVGVSFLAAATSSGTGTVSSPSSSGIANVEIVGDVQTTLAPAGIANSSGVSSNGGYIIVQTLQPQQTGTTTAATPVSLVAADPASGSALTMSFVLSNSSLLVQGE